MNGCCCIGRSWHYLKVNHGFWGCQRTFDSQKCTQVTFLLANQPQIKRLSSLDCVAASTCATGSVALRHRQNLKVIHGFWCCQRTFDSQKCTQVTFLLANWPQIKMLSSLDCVT